VIKRLLDSPWLYFGLAAVLVVVGLWSQLEVRGPARPTGDVDAIAALRDRDDLNVVFILIDTLRADHVGSYGYARDTSPFMDRLAEQGIRFSSVQAQSTWTKTSMASLWTALWPVSTGVLRWNQALPEGARMPAESFRENGRYTAGIYRNGWVASKFGFGQGFDTYYKPRARQTPARFQKRNPSAHPLQGSDADVTESAMEFLRSHGHEPFFLYLHYMDVHQYAYDAAIDAFGTSYMDAYDTAIRWTDHNIAVLFQALNEAGLLDETIVVIASDHGEAFGEHGFEGHAKSLYNVTTQVPLIVSLPFGMEPGIVVEEQVSNVDIFPTLFDIMGLPQMPEIHGRSLLPAIEAAARGEGPALEERPIYGELDRIWGSTEGESNPIASVLSQRWKLVHSVTGKEPDLLFDEENDPAEKDNLIESAPEQRARLETLIRAHLALPLASWGRPDDVDMTAEQLEQLRALGYVIDPVEEEPAGAGEAPPSDPSP